MQFFATALLAATAVSAAAIKRDVVFSVSDFSAACIAHSTQCSYSFGVIQPGTMETTPVTCSAMLTANNDGTLPDVTDGTCENSSRTWTVTRGDAGLVFTVSQQVTPSSAQSGTYTIPSTDLTKSDAPNASVESYTGPTAFDLQ
ncbi:hypothetical protein G7054_g2717 [Neopestalotiopsis clavispora]|nr:hypothetical protein E8E14_010101 [Neopestalotiopsis sp. 37M]KAF7538746.1 hypothetical protein G7054_g2717 [Neopestalotiopsis clavispora]